jgi:predicted extracellular nuclease
MPFADADYPERFEGMLVNFPQTLVISEYFNYERFGEMVIALPLAGETRPFTGTSIDEPGAPALAREEANSLRRITLDDTLGTQNPAVLRHPNGATFDLTNRFRGGDTVKNTVGVLGYDFGLYRIQPTAGAEYTSVNPRPAAPEPVGGTVRVAAMNTLNFFVTADYPTGNPLDNKCGPSNNVECRGWDSDQATEFTRQRDKLLTALSGLDADIIGLNELENSTGVEPLDSIVSGLSGYAYINTGTIGTDAIKVGLIYRSATVTPVGTYKLLTSAVDSRFIDTKSRPSLAQTFEVNATGAKFTVVVNHLKSKGSACDDVGDPDLGDGQGNCSQTRRAAAEALVDWIATDPTGSGDADFIIMGDLNSYAQEDTIDEIKAGSDDTVGTNDDFTNLISLFHGPFAYSYTFDGAAGYLDHALANANLLGQVTGAADWHINSDEPDIFDYDTTFKPDDQDVLYEVNPYRTSDHDPVVVGLNPLHYNFTGFFQPVDNLPVINSVKAGQAIPVKFSLGGDQGLNIFAAGYPKIEFTACMSGTVDAVETTVTAGNSSLSYDPSSDQYTYVWKTDKAWANKCGTLQVRFNDGATYTALFKFTK